jgi:hypothetical protein
MSAATESYVYRNARAAADGINQCVAGFLQPAVIRPAAVAGTVASDPPQ